MKKKLILCALTALATQVFGQNANTKLSGQFQGLAKTEWIYLSSFHTNAKDSVQHTDKGFQFDLDIPEGKGGFYILQIGKRPAEAGSTAFVFLEAGKLAISSKTANFSGAKFSGGKLADYYNTFQNRPKAGDTEELYRQFGEAQKQNDQEKLGRLRPQIQEQQSKQKELDKAFVLKNKNSTGIVYPVFFSLRDRNNLAELESILAQVSSKAKNNLPVKQIEHSIKTDKLTGIGRTALPFTQHDTSGRPVSLADFRGQYVLIDFWASWCVPCRVENPNVVSAFQQYKNKNFTVLGISFDNPGQHARWIQAIKDDNLDWTQLSDLKGWKNEVGKLYDIGSIPSNLLIDPNGVIVAKNLKGKKLDEKLNELLGQPQLDKGKYIIKGQVENEKQFRYFHINYMNEAGKMHLDSVPVFNGVFSYVGTIDVPTQVYSYFSNGEGMQAASAGQRQLINYYVEPGIISISGDTGAPKDISVSGSKVQTEYQAFNALIREEMDQLAPLNQAYNAGNMAYSKLKKEGATEEVLDAEKAKLEEIRSQMTPYQASSSKKQIDYFKSNPNSYITASQLRFYVSRMKVDELEAIVGQMDEEIRSSEAGKDILKEIARIKSGSAGSLAYNFSGTDINGQPLALADFKGQYVLVDFWASWCVPCRAGNPHLLQLYSKYKKKGFEIIGVSDDDSNHTAWKKAVDQDKIGVWKHVLRGLKRLPEGGFDKSEDKSQHYGVYTLPTKVLIDPNGIIIGRYASGAGNDQDLDNKLKEIFKF